MHRDSKENSDGQVGRRMDIRLGQIQPRRSRAKRRLFSVRASTPPGSREKSPRYHSRCSRSVASAAIRIKPNRPCVTAASSRANAVPAECPLYRSGHLQRNRRCPLWANSGRCVFIRLPYRFGRARSPTQKADVIVAAVTFQTELREE